MDFRPNFGLRNIPMGDSAVPGRALRNLLILSFSDVALSFLLSQRADLGRVHPALCAGRVQLPAILGLQHGLQHPRHRARKVRMVFDSEDEGDARSSDPDHRREAEPGDPRARLERVGAPQQRDVRPASRA